MEWLITADGTGEGVIEGLQSTTLDTGSWYGALSWTSSLYLAALRACEEMAAEMEDKQFAQTTRVIFERGYKNIAKRLWNGEYFIHNPDLSKPDSFIIGNGCHIDQVFGQGWAHQVGLGSILPKDKVKSALLSLWKYNFTPDVGPFRAVNNSGRWYAMPGEGGLIMTTWPKNDRIRPEGTVSPIGVGYLNECMSGFEYQVAGHMIWEGLVKEGLAITRTIHDRYHAARRNPWNEIECGDHYARAMASYGVFLAVCGYEYHGPKGFLSFVPKIHPEDFKAAFTAAEGWGSISQKREGDRQRNAIEVRWGKLRVRRLAFDPKDAATVSGVEVSLNGTPLAATYVGDKGRLFITLARAIDLAADQLLEVSIT